MLLHTASTCTDMQTALAKANSPRMNTGMVYATNLTIGTPPVGAAHLLAAVAGHGGRHQQETHPSFLLNRDG